MQQKSLEYQSSLIIFMYVFVSDTLEWFGIFLALNLLLKSWTMAFRQVYTKKEVWPKVVLKRLSLSLTHPYHCTNVVGMSIEKLFDMWRNYEILKYYVICAAVSALYWLSQFVLQKKNIGIGCVKIPKFVISSFRHIFSIDMPTTLI